MSEGEKSLDSSAPLTACLRLSPERIRLGELAEVASESEFKKSPELFIGEAGFRVTLEYAGNVSAMPIDAFLAVGDGGCPFLLGFRRKTCGIELVVNLYINPNLHRDLLPLKTVTVVDRGSDGEGTEYAVPLLHSPD
jgi:hypothetical protein